MIRLFIASLVATIFIFAPAIGLADGLINPETKFNHLRFIEIAIGEYGVFKSSPAIDGILTEGLASCIALILYHRETQTGLVAHFWPFKNIESSFQKIESSLKLLNIDPNQLEGYVQNGSTGTLLHVAKDIVDYTKKMGVKKLTVSIYGTPSYSGHNPANLLLELRSGQVRGYSQSTPTIKPQFHERIERYLSNREGPLDVTPNSL